MRGALFLVLAGFLAAGIWMVSRPDEVEPEVQRYGIRIELLSRDAVLHSTLEVIDVEVPEGLRWEPLNVGDPLPEGMRWVPIQEQGGR